MKTSKPRLLVYCSRNGLQQLLKETNASKDFLINEVDVLKDFPELDSLGLFDALLFAINPAKAEEELLFLHRFKARFPKLALPLLLFAEQDISELISSEEDLDIQDFFQIPISPRLLELRIKLHIEIRKDYLDGKKTNKALERKVKERTEAYRLAMLKAEGSERLKTAFLNNLSHELRTPMNGILGFLDFLEDPELEMDLRKQFIANVKNSSNRLLNTLHDLIEVSEIEAGSVKAEMGPTDLKALSNYLFDYYQDRCESKNITLILEYQLGSKDSIILSDEQKLKSVCFHLINNALKFTDSGEIRFGFKRKGDKITGYVKDTGCGISKENQAKIGQLFVQIEDYLTRSHDGLGIGLAIAKSFIESLKGQLFIESKLNEGSYFSFEIPFLSPSLESAGKKPEPSPIGSWDNLEVLIVDDDPVNLQLLKQIMASKSQKVHVAHNGVEALKALEDYPETNLVLMDLKMPVMDGYEAVEEIRNSGNEVFIIAQTAYAMTLDRERALAAGCDDYVSKPINKPLLMQKITEGLSK